MPQGKVKWFNNAKGYGFIIADEDCGELHKEDLFVHFSSIQMEGYKTLKAGQPVQFDTLPSGKGVHAINIIPLDAEGRPLTASSSSTQEAQQQTPEAPETPAAEQKQPARSEEKETVSA